MIVKYEYAKDEYIIPDAAVLRVGCETSDCG